MDSLHNFNTVYHFTNGTIVSVDDFVVNPVSISIVEGVKFAIAPIIHQNSMSGKIALNVKEDGPMEIDYDITPKEHQHKIEQELNRMYNCQTKKH